MSPGSSGTNASVAGRRPGRSRLFALLLGASLGLAFLALGAAIADPVGLTMELSRRRLLAAGARTETFQGPDGITLSALTLGRASGTSRAVVLLHGLGASGSYWADAGVRLAKQGRHVILPDAPGSGESETPRTPRGFSIAARVAALESLLSALDLRPQAFDLVGHSLGGWTAASFSLKNPRAARRLVLVDSGGFTPIAKEREGAAREALSPSSRSGGRALFGLLFHRPPHPTPAWAPLPGFVFDSFARNYRKDNVVTTVAQITEEDGLLGREGELPRGTALIWGERETLFPLSDARSALQRIPGARLYVVTGVGHDGPLEAPPVFFEALTRALTD